MRREPEEVRQEKVAAAKAANKGARAAQQAKNEGKTKMKGKNRPSKRHRKKQSNIIEEKKVGLGRWTGGAWHAQQPSLCGVS